MAILCQCCVLLDPTNPGARVFLPEKQWERTHSLKACKIKGQVPKMTQQIQKYLLFQKGACLKNPGTCLFVEKAPAGAHKVAKS